MGTIGSRAARGVALLVLIAATVGCESIERRTEMSAIPTGYWRAQVMVGPEQDLPLDFGIELERSSSGWSASIHNSPEWIDDIPVKVDGDKVIIAFPHYDSSLRARLDDDGRLVGEFRKRRGVDTWARLPFSADHVGDVPALDAAGVTAARPYLGTWAVDFASSEEPAIAVVRDDGGRPWSTVMTTTGDYRYLATEVEDDTLVWTCFDGAHLFLFRARLDDRGGLIGDFWSGDHWHETFVAEPSNLASLPDAFALTTWDETVPLSELAFPDLEGNLRRLGDPAFDGELRLLHVFGSWCPNCHDAAVYLAELEKRYGDRGLSILGLAFELTGDFERDARQVRRYLKRHDTDYPVLIAGPADKAKATEAFRALDRIRSYPTTVFMDADGNVLAIHTGFSGPATGDAHQELRRRFEATIEAALSASPE